MSSPMISRRASTMTSMENRPTTASSSVSSMYVPARRSSWMDSSFAERGFHTRTSSLSSRMSSRTRNTSWSSSSDEFSSRRASLGKDQDLWFPDGNCHVHLYKEGQSLRGPSFRLPFSVVSESGYSALPKTRRPSTLSRDAPAAPFKDRYDLYLAAPASYDRSEVFEFHMVTRNLFRCFTNQPLVGDSLATALIQLYERLLLWTESKSRAARQIATYMKNQGYSSLAEKPVNAIATLALAERFEMASLWSNALAHCVGMYHEIESSAEWDVLSPSTQYTISTVRANLQRDFSVASILMIDFDTIPLDLYLTLSPAEFTRSENFASFIAVHCQETIGQLPTDLEHFDRLRYVKARNELYTLYDYMVAGDAEAHGLETWNEYAATTAHSLMSFNVKNGYKPLKHLLPQVPASRWRSRRRSLRSTGSSLAAKYAMFEQENTSVGSQKARLLDWTLVYSLLQALTWVTSASESVQDTDTSYPLCCDTTNTCPWVGRAPARPSTPGHLSSSLPKIEPLRTRSTSVAASTTLSRPAPTARVPFRVNTIMAPRRKPAHVEIIIPIYGNGSHASYEDSIGYPSSSSASDSDYATDATSPASSAPSMCDSMSVYSQPGKECSW